MADNQATRPIGWRRVMTGLCTGCERRAGTAPVKDLYELQETSPYSNVDVGPLVCGPCAIASERGADDHANK
jgi:hypothetical protein